MQTLKIKTYIDSEILYIPELKNLIGKNAEIIILTEAEKVSGEKDRMLKEAYDTVFSDESVCREQLDTALWFERAGNDRGEIW